MGLAGGGVGTARHLDLPRSALIVIDLQDRLLRLIRSRDRIIAANKLLIRYYKLNNYSIIATRQVKIGDIDPEITSELGDIPIVEKDTFSCLRNKEFQGRLLVARPETLILTGIETHICIYATAIDALKEGYNVVIPYDATGSVVEEDAKWALETLAMHGAIILQSETIIYADMASPSHPVFKKILPDVKERRNRSLDPANVIGSRDIHCKH